MHHDVKISGARIRTHDLYMDPKASVLPTTPQRPKLRMVCKLIEFGLKLVDALMHRAYIRYVPYILPI